MTEAAAGADAIEPAPEPGFDPRHIAVIGCGLIGASVALAARRARPDTIVSGYDPRPGAAEEARAVGAIGRVDATIAECVRDAAFVVVATPVGAIEAAARESLRHAHPHALVTDVGSTKARVCAALEDDRFVGGHPIAGAESSGAAHARHDLFRGATWFLCSGREQAKRRVEVLVEACAARPARIDPDEHDHLMALTSHLPHALANAVVNVAGRDHDGAPLRAHGGSFRDLTRVAGANPPMWGDIFSENRAAVGRVLAMLRDELDRFEAALASRRALDGWIDEAAGRKAELLRASGLPEATLWTVRLRVPDRPGVLAHVFGTLAAAGLDVEDVTLHHVDRGTGGTLTVFLAGEATAERAAALLDHAGFAAITGPAE